MLRKGAAVLLACLFSHAAYAAEIPQGPWAHPEVLKAALGIGMSDEQQPKFRDGVTNFFNCRVLAFNKLMKGRDQVDIERKLRSKTNGCLRKMDKEMAGFLNEGQVPKYETYRETLLQFVPGMQ